jgi:drug/metabolite transporter (DMT)-like permease
MPGKGGGEELSLSAVLLVGFASIAHASWNLLSKQASRVGGAGFVWLAATVAALIYAPIVAIFLLVHGFTFGWPALLFLVGTALLHTAYYSTLQRGYQVGDLSLVYPTARGTGPLLSSFAAVWLYGERPGVVGVLGILLITGGVFALGLPSRAGAGLAAGIGYGVLTGLLIAMYTLWDAYAVSSLAVPALLLAWSADVGRAVLLAPLASRRRPELAVLWRDYRRQVLGTAVLSPLSYVLILIALSMYPVSVVAPAREMSVLIGVLLGGTLLAEGQLLRRLPAAVAIAAGVVAVAVG